VSEKELRFSHQTMGKKGSTTFGTLLGLKQKKRMKQGLPSGKHLHNYGKIHHFQWVNPLFRLGHFQVRELLVITKGWSAFHPQNQDFPMHLVDGW